MIGKKRLEILKARFAWLGRQIRLSELPPELPPEPPGMACFRSGSKPKAAKKPKAALSLARPGWIGYTHSNGPGGESICSKQPHWVRQPFPQPSRGLKRRRPRGHSAFAAIGQKLPPFKLLKLPPKFPWQA